MVPAKSKLLACMRIQPSCHHTVHQSSCREVLVGEADGLGGLAELERVGCLQKSNIVGKSDFIKGLVEGNGADTESDASVALQVCDTCHSKNLAPGTKESKIKSTVSQRLCSWALIKEYCSQPTLPWISSRMPVLNTYTAWERDSAFLSTEVLCLWRITCWALVHRIVKGRLKWCQTWECKQAVLPARQQTPSPLLAKNFQNSRLAKMVSFSTGPWQAGLSR